MDVEISWLGVILAAIAGMVVGGIWYAPQAFGTEWAKIVGLKEKDMKEGAPKAMAGAFVLSIITAYVVAHVTYISSVFFDMSLTSAGISTGFWLWLGIGFTTLLTQGLFERRPAKWMAIVAGNLLVTLVLMGWIIGLVGV